MKLVLVVFKKNYRHYRKGDLATLTLKIARRLEEQGIVEIVSVPALREFEELRKKIDKVVD